MSIQTSLPKDWKDIKIDDKLVFVNLKENIISYHPPFDISNINIFLKLYQFKTNKSDFISLINKNKISNITKSNAQPIQEGNPNMTKTSIISDPSIINQSVQLVKLKETYDLNKITDGEKIKMIRGFWENSKTDLQSVLKKIVQEKYSTNLNFEYLIESLNNKIIYVCAIRVKQNFQICRGESYVSKSKSKDSAIRIALKLLVPELYATMIIKEVESFPASSSLFSNNNSIINDIIDLDSQNSIQNLCSIDLSNNSNSNLNSNNIFSSNIYNENRTKNDFLSKKRNKENKEESSSANENSNEDDYVSGGCLVEDLYGNLQIDDPLVVDKYLTCSNFTPNITSNPKVDVNEKSFVRNDGIKFEKIKNDNYIKIILESQILNIRVECSSDNKKLAREYCAQKFLKKLYQNRFSKWVDLVKYYEEKGYIKDRVVSSMNSKFN